MSNDTSFTTHGDEPAEARIVAWVLGEASAFEASELEKLCHERPELMVFKHRMEALHGMIAEAHQPAAGDPWTLPADKRRVIEALIGPPDAELERERRVRRSGRRALLTMAACLVLTVIVAGLMTPVLMKTQKEERRAHAATMTEEGQVQLQAAVSFTNADAAASVARGSDSRGVNMIPFSQVAKGPLPDELIEGTPKPILLPHLQPEEQLKRRALAAMDRFSSSGMHAEAQNKLKTESTESKPSRPQSSPVKMVDMKDGLSDDESAPPTAEFGSRANFGQGWGDRHGRDSIAKDGRKESTGIRQDLNVDQLDANAMTSDRPIAREGEEIRYKTDAFAQPEFEGWSSHGATIAGGVFADKAMNGGRFGLTPDAGADLPVPGDAPVLGSLYRGGQVTPGEVLESGKIDLYGERESSGDSSGDFSLDSKGRSGRPQGNGYDYAEFKKSLDHAVPGDKAAVGSELGLKMNALSSRRGAELAELDQDVGRKLDMQAQEMQERQRAFRRSGQHMLNDVFAEKWFDADSLAGDPAAKQTRIITRHVEVTQANSEELGFDWLTDRLDPPAPEEWNRATKVRKAKQQASPPVDDEITTAANPFSTFSLNISDASFKIAQAAMARGEQPDPAGIKLEQFYNAVDYGDASPQAGQPVTAHIEQAAHPVIPGRKLVRIAVKTAAVGRAQGQALRLTLLVDQSGSMGRDDRRRALAEALEGLSGLLGAQDVINVVGFSRTPHLLAEGIHGSQGRKLADLINQDASEGGTNLEEAIKLGEQLAKRYQQEGAQNRMVLFTDGAANLGDADPESLAEKIKQLRQKGIAFDIAGIAADGLNDELLGELARHGNGRYYVVGKGGKADFARQLAGAFRPAAENVKVQVRFNPQRVARYKLIGFEKDRLKKEDFRNDSVDAAEMAAEEAGVAIYQVEPLADGEGEGGIGEISVRFRDVASGLMVERSWMIPHDPTTPVIERAQPSMQLATLAMLVGEKLKGGALADAIDFKQFAKTHAAVKRHFGQNGRVAELLEMIDLLK